MRKRIEQRGGTLNITPSQLAMTQLINPETYERQLREDVCAWLDNPTECFPPPKYFYDAHGSQLFDRITRLPEYYLTRAETEIFEARAGDIMARARPVELVEIGSGYARKTRLLLEAMRRHGGQCYVAFDVSEAAIHTAAHHLTADYPWLAVKGVVGDFNRHLGQIPDGPRRMVAFLGSTIGNFVPGQRVAFLRGVRALLRAGDTFLLGVDLVKDAAVLRAAYDDAAGVTAEFNRNMLRVLNRELDGDVPVDAFEHRAVYDAGRTCIEMRLRATRTVTARFHAVNTTLRVAAGDELRTEYSCKFTRAGVERTFIDAGLRLECWYTDARGYFAVALARRA